MASLFVASGAVGFGELQDHPAVIGAPPKGESVAVPRSGLSPTVGAAASRSAAPQPATAGQKKSQRRAGVPLRVTLPAIGVDADVVPITPVGDALVPPDDPQQLGWWSGGVRPGAGQGRAVVTGHTVHSGGGALDDLEQLRPGDQIAVFTEHGQLEYVVRWTRYFTVEQLAERAHRLFRATGQEQLVMATCENWDGSDYDGNVVVVAVPAA